MAHKSDLPECVVEALKELGGAAPLVGVSKAIWRQHESELRESGDLFYTWPYDLRWPATSLRKNGRLADNGRREPWRLIR